MLKINVQLRRGDFVLDLVFDQTSRVNGVFGPSGAGKSTLIDMIAGLTTPDSGRIELAGETLFDSAKRINVPPHKRRIGVMFQDDRLFPHMNVAANIGYGHRLPKDVKPRLTAMEQDELVVLLGLSELLSRSISTLSGGERQRVALCRALKSEPRLLLLDEPLSSLDAGLKRQILPYLAKVRDVTRIPVLYVSHDLTEILQITDHLLLLEAGRVVAHGAFGELAFSHPAISALRDGGLVNVYRANRLQGSAADSTMSLSLNRLAAPEAGESPTAPVVHAALHAPIAAGDSIDVVIRASDVAIALQHVQGVSIQNQLRGEIRRLMPHSAGVIVEVDVGVPMLAELTQRAVQSLQLQPGRAAWCLIKSNAIRQAT